MLLTVLVAAQQFLGTVAAVSPVAAMLADGVHPGLCATAHPPVSEAGRH